MTSGKLLTLKEYCETMGWCYPLPEPGTSEAEEWLTNRFRMTVLGDCGIVHPSFEDWQRCSTCEAIIKSRRRGEDRSR